MNKSSRKPRGYDGFEVDRRVVQVLNKIIGTFDSDDEAMANALAGRAAVTIENNKFFVSTIQKNMELLEIKQPLETTSKTASALSSRPRTRLAREAASSDTTHSATRVLGQDPRALSILQRSGDFRFQGMWQDQSTKLYYVRARTYDTHRAIRERDPLLGAPQEVESHPPYNFANANPIINTDPTGLFTIAELQCTDSQDASSSLPTIHRAAWRANRETCVVPGDRGQTSDACGLYAG